VSSAGRLGRIVLHVDLLPRLPDGTIAPPLEWTPEALALLDDLWARGVHRTTIQRQLKPPLGRTLESKELREMATREGAPVPVVPAPPEVVPMSSGQPRRPVDRVKLVARGTYKVSGFSMLGGRI
jgi:hypothetical protein